MRRGRAAFPLASDPIGIVPGEWADCPSAQGALMRTHAHRFVFGGALIMAVCLLAGSGGAGEKEKVWKQFLPAKAYKELVTRAAKNAEEALTGTPSEEAIK